MKFTRRVPGGKAITALLERGRNKAAIEAVRETERELILRRRQLNELARKFSVGNEQRARYESQIKRVNNTLTKLGTFLRG